MSANALRVVVYYSARKLRRRVLLSRSHYGEDAEVLGNRVLPAPSPYLDFRRILYT